jgi:hypothetical protein
MNIKEFIDNEYTRREEMEPDKRLAFSDPKLLRCKMDCNLEGSCFKGGNYYPYVIDYAACSDNNNCICIFDDCGNPVYQFTRSGTYRKYFALTCRN